MKDFATKHMIFALSVVACATFAHAEEQNQSASPQIKYSSPSQPIKKPKVGMKHHGATGAAHASSPQKPNAANKREAKRTPPALSKSAYVRLLSAELRRRVPQSTPYKGSVDVSFTIGASGRVTQHEIKAASDPELKPLVAEILASVHTPPPPGGSFKASQQFSFH